MAISDLGCRRIVKEGYFDPFRREMSHSGGEVASASNSPVSLHDVVPELRGVGVDDFTGQQARYGQMRGAEIPPDPQLGEF